MTGEWVEHQSTEYHWLSDDETIEVWVERAELGSPKRWYWTGDQWNDAEATQRIAHGRGEGFKSANDAKGDAMRWVSEVQR